MKKDFMWAYMLMLSNHYCDDQNGLPRGLYLKRDYTEENNIDLETWDSMVEFLAEKKYNTILVDLGDQVIYDSHPEISAPGAFSKELVKKKLDEIRALGMTPIPKLNFSACHHVWLHQYNRMVGTPKYYEVVSDLIAEVCELFDNPELFHLGLDEENYDCQYKWNEKILIRGEALWWHDLYFYFNEVEKNGVRPWVWSDYVWHHPDLFFKKMPHEVLQSNWYYENWQDYSNVYYDGHGISDSGYLANFDLTNKICQDTYERLDKAGYEDVPTCSTYASQRNQFQTLYHCKEKISEEHLKGFMTAPWRATGASEKYMLLNDANRFYLARKDVYPESL